MNIEDSPFDLGSTVNSNGFTNRGARSFGRMPVQDSIFKRRTQNKVPPIIAAMRCRYFFL